LKRIDSFALILEDRLGERQTKWILFCRPRNIEGVTGIAGAAGLGRECWFFSGALGHHVARFAQNPFKGLALAFRTLHFHGVIRLRNNLLKKITALKTSKLKNGHKRSSKNTRFHDNDVKL
jgi:hypothetical protein